MYSRVLARLFLSIMAFWVCLKSQFYHKGSTYCGKSKSTVSSRESFLIQVCNRLSTNISKLMTGLSSPSRDTLPELLMKLPKTRVSFLSSSGIFWLLRDMQKINKAATRQKAKTKDVSEALGTIKLANWPLSNWELATF